MHSGKQKNKLLCLCSYIRDKTLPTAVYLISCLSCISHNLLLRAFLEAKMSDPFGLISAL